MFVIRREPHNPILAPLQERPWESVATYNPSAVRTEDGVRLYYRALGNPSALATPLAEMSTIGTAFSEDGVHFHSRQQIIMPSESWDQFGCEDPRVTFFEGRWYCFYTALGGYPFGPDNIKVAVAIGDLPDNFIERHLITPFDAKAATIFPERIDGDIVMLLTAHTDWTPEHPRPTIALARAKKIEDFFDTNYWNEWHDHLADHALGDLRRDNDVHIEVGASPLLTDAGWLLIYSYIQDYYDEHKRIFSIAAALLDAKNPQNVISHTESILVPQEFYEEYGLIPHIVFPTSATIDPSTTLGVSDRLEIWYGGADTVCAKASVKLHDLLRALDPNRPARTFTRAPENPILSPQGNGFESREVMNAAAIEINDSIYILYRAMDAENTSTVGLAISKNGVVIDERLPEPIYTPRADFEMKKGSPTGNSGCEDPRIVRIENTLYLTYTAYDGVHPPSGAVSSISVDDFLARKFEKWSMPLILTPDGVDDKDLALLPEKINLSGQDGNYLLYHRINNQICADLLPDIVSGKRASRCIEIMGPRHGMWDGVKVGVAAPPIRVGLPPDRAGGQGDKWLMIYHGVSRHARYRLGAALLDTDGLTVLARTADPIFEPLEKYEKEGTVPDVVFSCGAVVCGDTLYLYYGAADKVLGVATASLAHIVDSLS
ncbi:MAG: hypothetical protein NTU85_01580 [Candidatus Kaiserbacteria bacterium]|nr:hypothetical protein [Candidatus Kaiserbacteria bacterium]